MSKWFNEKMMPRMMKFVDTKVMTAIKNGMLVSLPFIMIGSIFLLLSAFPIPAVSNWMNATGLTPFWTQAYNASFGVMAIFAVVGISYSWVKAAGYEPLPAGMTALVGFLIIMRPTSAVMNGTKTVILANQAPTMLGGFIDRTWLGGQGMIAAILVGLFTGWIYSWFLKHRITIKLPSEVPPAVSESFVALIPAFVIVSSFLGVYIGFDLLAHETATQWIYSTIQIPLQGITDSAGGVFLVGIMIPFIWFFGVHGSTIIGSIMGPLLQANALQNATIFKAHHIVTATLGGHVFIQSLLDQFGTVTGAGMTMGIAIYMLFFAKSAQLKGIGKLAIIPAFFNINEPILFGLPIVLNPFMFLPFIFMPTFSMLSTYFLIKVGILPYLNGVMIPWTTPPIISGFLVGGWKVMIWQTIIIASSFFVYLPFVRKEDQIIYAKEQAKDLAAKKA